MTSPGPMPHIPPPPPNSHLAGPRRERIFNSDILGYELTMPGVMISSDITLAVNEGAWTASQPVDGGKRTITGTGRSAQQATLALIAVRLGYADPGPVLAAAQAWGMSFSHDPDSQAVTDLHAAVNTYTAEDTAW